VDPFIIDEWSILLNFIFIPKYNLKKLLGARGEIIVSITHSLVVERLLFKIIYNLC
jgi:hypothetical protein